MAEINYRIVGGSEMEFICLFYFYGILIILLFIRSDQENHMVYRTDYEVYFQKIETKEAWKIFWIGFGLLLTKSS